VAVCGCLPWLETLKMFLESRSGNYTIVDERSRNFPTDEQKEI
jgi:hypothetical protein